MMSGNAESDQAYVRMQGENLPYLIWIDRQGVIQDANIKDEDVLENFERKHAEGGT